MLLRTTRVAPAILAGLLLTGCPTPDTDDDGGPPEEGISVELSGVPTEAIVGEPFDVQFTIQAALEQEHDEARIDYHEDRLGALLYFRVPREDPQDPPTEAGCEPGEVPVEVETEVICLQECASNADCPEGDACAGDGVCLPEDPDEEPGNPFLLPRVDRENDGAYRHTEAFVCKQAGEGIIAGEVNVLAAAGGDSLDFEEFESVTVQCKSPENNGQPNNTNSMTNGTSNNISTGDLRFVLIEDSSSDDEGDHPGSDIDAVQVCKPDDTCHPSSAVEEISSAATYPNGIMGQPLPGVDGCVDGYYTSLGGESADGYVIVSFLPDVTIESGDEIVVHEVDPTTCPPSGTEENDAFTVSVSDTASRDTFTEIGTGDTENNSFTVP